MNAILCLLLLSLFCFAGKQKAGDHNEKSNPSRGPIKRFSTKVKWRRVKTLKGECWKCSAPFQTSPADSDFLARSTPEEVWLWQAHHHKTFLDFDHKVCTKCDKEFWELKNKLPNHKTEKVLFKDLPQQFWITYACKPASSIYCG